MLAAALTQREGEVLEEARRIGRMLQPGFEGRHVRVEAGMGLRGEDEKSFARILGMAIAVAIGMTVGMAIGIAIGMPIGMPIRMSIGVSIVLAIDMAVGMAVGVTILCQRAPCSFKQQGCIAATKT